MHEKVHRVLVPLCSLSALCSVLLLEYTDKFQFMIKCLNLELILALTLCISLAYMFLFNEFSLLN